MTRQYCHIGSRTIAYLDSAPRKNDLRTLVLLHAFPIGANLWEPQMRSVPVGWCSMGGYATFAVYQSHPEMIDGLIFANTRATADTPEARANRRNMLALVDREGPSGVVRDMMPKLLGK